ncbi:MAG: hypothetical protein M3R13_03880 [Armatimonadota bacterium]|nr:hypothetical protein [Armatimonadota bacterium]
MRYLTVFLAASCFGASHAQWTLVSLNPGQQFSSEGHGVHSGRQVGSIIVGKPNAAVWSGTPGSWVGLTPAGALYSEGRGAYGNRQVGNALFNGFFHGGVWTGTAASWVDLTPEGADQSAVNGIYENIQVGDAFDPPRASMWFGSAASRTDLHPAGAFSSTARGIHTLIQAGSADFGTGDHAGTWSGSAASWVDLHPPNATTSQAWGMHLGDVVGMAVIGGVTKAYLWRDQGIDLHPPGADLSHAYAVSHGRQVGYAVNRGIYGALIWAGTRKSVHDLHAYLPPGSTYSIAKSIHVDGDWIQVVGMGNIGGGTEALLWKARTVVPASFSMVRGLVAGGNLASLGESDDNRLVLNPGIVFSAGEPPVQIRFDATAPSASPSGFSFAVESRASFPNCLQSVALWNYTLGVYEFLNSETLAFR